MGLVQPYYPKERQPGRPVIPLGLMFNLNFLQMWSWLSEPQTDEIMDDSLGGQRFLWLDLGRDRPPDETTIRRFRYLIESHNLGSQILKDCQYPLQANSAASGDVEDFSVCFWNGSGGKYV
ncbi:MAG: transposase [Thermogutta sp.]